MIIICECSLWNIYIPNPRVSNIADSDLWFSYPEFLFVALVKVRTLKAGERVDGEPGGVWTSRLYRGDALQTWAGSDRPPGYLAWGGSSWRLVCYKMSYIPLQELAWLDGVVGDGFRKGVSRDWGRERPSAGGRGTALVVLSDEAIRDNLKEYSLKLTDLPGGTLYWRLSL